MGRFVGKPDLESFPNAAKRGIKLFSRTEISGVKGYESLYRAFSNKKAEELCGNPSFKKWSKDSHSWGDCHRVDPEEDGTALQPRRALDPPGGFSGRESKTEPEAGHSASSHNQTTRRQQHTGYAEGYNADGNHDNSGNELEETSVDDDRDNELEETSVDDNSGNELEETSVDDDRDNELEETSVDDNSGNELEETSVDDNSGNELEETSVDDDSANELEETGVDDDRDNDLEETGVDANSDNELEDTPRV
ncbi:hypothetical protein OS493_000427 [Desmophyllum pertusum]|uniref:Uncharacterized protein n=1 Tax=Desmophyllum pertusum TaxID=174260 RepID=A0A9X0A886_9CNID|nr:hypothetical protein OS493_000427 [Desmophyllum pertusum]